MPLIDVVGPIGADLAPDCGRTDRIIADFGVALRMRIDTARRDGARAFGRRGRCQDTASCPAAARRSSRSRGGQNPPCHSRFAGRQKSPRRRDRPSSPAADRQSAGAECRADSRACRNVWPTRPGEECSWCRMRRTGLSAWMIRRVLSLLILVPALAGFATRAKWTRLCRTRWDLRRFCR